MSKFKKFFSPNIILRKLGYKIIKDEEFLSKEFRRLTNDNNINKIRFKIIAEKLKRDFSGSLNLRINTDNIVSIINQFDRIFRKFPFKNLEGGFGYNNALMLFVFIKILKPSRIIESGVFKGFTTYIIENAADEQTEIICIEPNDDRIKYQTNKAKYYRQDISEIRLSEKENTLVFFDDHVPHKNRLNLIKEKNFKYIIFDDDVNLSNFYHDGDPPIPTINMIRNDDPGYKTINWIYDNKKKTKNYEINEKDKSIFLDYDYLKFPELFEFTGYRSSSFSSIIIKKN